jgi:hypothetical protein
MVAEWMLASGLLFLLPKLMISLKVFLFFIFGEQLKVLKSIGG